MVERVDLSDVELARVDERRVLDVLLRLSPGLRGRVQRRCEEVGEEVSPAIVLPLPHHRADELPDLDGDRSLLEHLPRRRLLERLARLVVARGEFPIHAVRPALPDHEQAAVVHDDSACSGQRRPAHAASTRLALLLALDEQPTHSAGGEAPAHARATQDVHPRFLLDGVSAWSGVTIRGEWLSGQNRRRSFTSSL